MTASNATSRRKALPKNRTENEDSSSSTAERFTLSGPSIPLDPLIHAFRSDLADIALAGQLFAPHYARPVARLCLTPGTIVYASASESSERLFEMDQGEEFALLDVTGRWAWGYRRSDHRVGYLLADHLQPAA